MRENINISKIDKKQQLKNNNKVLLKKMQLFYIFQTNASK